MPADAKVFLKTVRPALQKADAGELAKVVLAQWDPTDLCQLVDHSNVDVRRVTAICLGLVGDKAATPCLVRALHDQDEQVNQMAEHGLWSIWFRSGKPEAARSFREGVSLLAKETYEAAIERFVEANRIDPQFAEAHNQRAIAHYLLAQWHESIEGCSRALKLVPVHFGAISGMGHCYAQLGELDLALKCYKRSLMINPRMPAIARAIERLRARIRDNDSSGIYTAAQLPA